MPTQLGSGRFSLRDIAPRLPAEVSLYMYVRI